MTMNINETRELLEIIDLCRNLPKLKGIHDEAMIALEKSSGELEKKQIEDREKAKIKDAADKVQADNEVRRKNEADAVAEERRLNASHPVPMHTTQPIARPSAPIERPYTPVVEPQTEYLERNIPNGDRRV